MEDKLHHTAKPKSGQPPFPSTKAQLFNHPIYRTQPPPKSKPLRGCCCCILLLLLSLLLIAVVAVVAVGIFYAIYHPRSPTFSISSLRLSALNLSSNHLTSQIDIAVSIRNPNRKIAYLYDPFSVSASSNGVSIGEGTFPAFFGGAKNTTVMRGTASSSGQIVGASAASDLRKRSVPVEIEMETRAGIKVGKVKTKKIEIKVYCGGIEIAAPKGKKKPPPFTSETSCKVKLRIKIWKWTI